MQVWHYILAAMIVIPAALGAYAAFSKSESAIGHVDRARLWVQQRYAVLQSSPAFWKRHGLRWLLWPVLQLPRWTQPIADRHLQCGARAAGYALSGMLAVSGVVALVSATVMAIVFGLMLMVALWLVSLALGGDSDRSGTDRSDRSWLRGSKTRDRTDWTGEPYQEHVDKDDRVVAQSRHKTGILGDAYVRHTGPDGELIGTSVQRQGLVGDAYTEHTDSQGQPVGQSRVRTDIWGDRVTSHIGTDGEVVAESRTKVGLFGDRYTEHKAKD